MGIHLLDNSLINKIAAGEVVERPASIVKELVENSIDAGSTAITIEIADGGISLIKITDNGKGIPSNDVRTAFLRHATSKLNAIEDLDDILTLGFRGEALSSIASIAQVEMVTKTIDEELGKRIVINAGTIETEEDIAANVGTIFTVKNVFYNIPARRKFLKKPATEGGYITEIVNRIALGHPQVAIKYINNGNCVMQTNGNNDLKSTVLYVYGKAIASQMLEVNYSKDGFNVVGLVAKPELSRGNRNYENFFINGRYIKSNIMSDPAENAYKGKLMVGKFPVFMLNFKVPSNTVDVNVHPTKLEVRFSDENLVYDIIYTAVQKSLDNATLIPNVSWDKKPKVKAEPINQIVLNDDDNFLYDDAAIMPTSDNILNEAVSKNENKGISIAQMLYADSREILNKQDLDPDVAHNIKSDNIKLSDKQNTFNNNSYGNAPLINHSEFGGNKANIKKEALKEELDAPARKVKAFFNNYKIVGQIFATYWIIEQDNTMYVIDQHAAHERTLYEELTQKIKGSTPSSQILLSPIAVNLSDSEKIVVEENKELLESFGFEIDEFGTNSYAIRAVPYIFDEISNVNFFIDIVDILADKNVKNLYDTKEDAIAMMSCKAAVKANNRLSYIEAKSLVQRLLTLENPFTCPHGRPTIIEMSKYELEKKFKRIQD